MGFAWHRRFLRQDGGGRRVIGLGLESEPKPSPQAGHREQEGLAVPAGLPQVIAEATCELVYATSGYESSVANLASSSLSSDNVFSDDDGASQLAAMSGSVAAGFSAALTVGVDV